MIAKCPKAKVHVAFSKGPDSEFDLEKLAFIDGMDDQGNPSKDVAVSYGETGKMPIALREMYGKTDGFNVKANIGGNKESFNVWVVISVEFEE